MRSLITCAGLVALSSLIACAAAPQEGVGMDEAHATEAAPALSVVKGREYARCWFDVVGQDAKLSCTSTARGNDPLGARVEVVAAGMAGTEFKSATAKLDVEAGGTVVVGTLPLTAFPLITLDLHVELTPDAHAAIGEQKNIDFYNHVKVNRPSDLPPSNPAIIKQSYDLWPLAFIDARGDWSGYVVSASYTHSIAPYESFLSNKEMVLEPEFFTRERKGQIAWFVAPESGKLELKLQAAGKPTATITAPGYYVSTNDDFRLATPEEIALDFKSATAADAGPTPTDPSTTDAGPTDPGATDAGPATPDPEPVDPTPGCGGPNEARCSDQGCDDGARFDSSSNKCVACGLAGQTFCYKDPKHLSINQGTFCSAGTRLDSSKSQCVACGDVGETFCYKDPDHVSINQGTSCNAGTRFDSSKSQCVACGGEGQTFCYVDPNGVSGNSGTRCDAGLRIQGSVCVK
ncbi:MAG: hypothetical protein U0270_07555 [Labilithrix sp.]